MLITMSIAFHSFVAAAAVAMSIQTSSIPMNTPRQMEMLQEVLPVVLPPQGNPDAPRNPQPQQPPAAQHEQTAPQQPPQDVTPNQIPNSVPTVGTTDTAGQGNTDGRDTHGQWGVPDGDKHGVDTGQPAAQVSIP